MNKKSVIRVSFITFIASLVEEKIRKISISKDASPINVMIIMLNELKNYLLKTKFKLC